MSQRFSFALTALLALAGCASPLSEILVDVHVEGDLRDSTRALRVEIDAREIGGEVVERDVPFDPASSGPFRFPLVHRGGELGPIHIAAAARGDDGVLLRVEADTAFVAHRTIVLPIELSSACRDVRCGMNTHCEAGDCVPNEVGEDAGVDEVEDAGPEQAPDAGNRCEPSCDRGGRRCDCEEGCACNIACPSGEDCEARCDGDCEVDARGGAEVKGTCDGASCSFDATDAGRVDEITCEHGADCEVDCRGTSPCTVECRSDSSCLVQCDPGLGCYVLGCGLPRGADDDDRDDRDLVSCGDGVWACRRACPSD